MKRLVAAGLIAGALLGLPGCGAAERRLVILKQCKIVLDHSKTEFDFEPERKLLEQHLKEELDGGE